MADQDDFVIYLHEWYENGSELGPYGRYHLNEIVKRLPKAPWPVLVQICWNEELNQTRRQMIVAALGMKGIPDPDQRVIVGFPKAEGLYGTEGMLIWMRTWAGLGGFGFGGGMGGGGGGGGGMAAAVMAAGGMGGGGMGGGGGGGF